MGDAGADRPGGQAGGYQVRVVVDIALQPDADLDGSAPGVHDDHRQHRQRPGIAGHQPEADGDGHAVEEPDRHRPGIEKEDRPHRLEPRQLQIEADRRREEARDQPQPPHSQRWPLPVADRRCESHP
jgi:hypothetical protein